MCVCVYVWVCVKFSCFLCLGVWTVAACDTERGVRLPEATQTPLYVYMYPSHAAAGFFFSEKLLTMIRWVG